MNDQDNQDIAISVAIPPSPLGERLLALLTDLPGVRLAAPGEPADFTIAAAEAASAIEEALTPRELEVLALVAAGDSNKAIARKLGISAHTAKFHVGSLLDKLDATGRTDAVAHASRLGILRL